MRWFQCLFIGVLPFTTVFRIWDGFLLRRSAELNPSSSADVGYVISVAVALVRLLVREFIRLREQLGQPVTPSSSSPDESPPIHETIKLDSDSLIKLLIATVDKRTGWKGLAWAEAGKADVLCEEVCHTFTTSTLSVPFHSYTHVTLLRYVLGQSSDLGPRRNGQGSNSLL